MTREEALTQLRLGPGINEDVSEEYNDAVNMAIKALEQEPALDEIRAEIEQYQSDYDVHGTEYDRTAWKAFNRCLQIIDKYKAEIELQ